MSARPSFIPDPEVVRREIEVRAYELHVAHGCHHGSDVEDWMQAETEVLKKYGLPSAWFDLKRG